MENTLEKNQKQIYNERTKVRKHCKEMIMTCCDNAWAIPTDDMKKQILISHGWDNMELEFHFLQFLEGGMTDKQIENVKHYELNALLTFSFFIFAAQTHGYEEEYNDIMWGVVDWFKNI